MVLIEYKIIYGVEDAIAIALGCEGLASHRMGEGEGWVKRWARGGLITSFNIYILHVKTFTSKRMWERRS